MAKTDLLYCLKITQTDGDSGASKSTIVFPNMEYSFIFYDPTYAKLYNIIALVEDVYEDQIKIKYLKNNIKDNNSNTTCNCYSTTIDSSNDNSITSAQGMPNCSCIINPPDLSKYEGPATLFIPIQNIINIGYRWTQNSNVKDSTEVRVMLLGISATAVKAIIVRMSFFEDNIEDAVKLVDLKAGNIYDITYESCDGATYESRAKVINIEEVDDGKPCKPGKGYVREHVGCGNSVYTDCTCSKDEFMTAPPVKKIKIVVDTSESFTGRYETIMLDAIRDCTLVYDATKDETSDYYCENEDYCHNCAYRTESCHPKHCGHYIPPIKHGCGCETMPQTYVYAYNGMRKAVITGDKVSITCDGNTTEVDLEALVKYYLGVD